MNLHSKFRFWPVNVAIVLEGWACGAYITLQGATHRDLLARGRIRWGRRRQGEISEAQVKKSFLHYAALAVALEADPILRETYDLDELRFSEPNIVFDEERATQAFLEFMNLPDRDDTAAIRYIHEFGEFDYVDVEKDGFVGSGIPESVQEFCKQCVREQKEPFALPLSMFWDVRNDIESLRHLSIALSDKDPQRVRDECIRRRPHSPFDPEPNWLAIGKAILCADLSASLNPPEHQNPRVILSDMQDELVALTMCNSVRSALYFTLFSMITSQTEYKKCPHCKKHFIVTVKRKKYCTDVCQNAAKVRRYRTKHKGDASSLSVRASNARSEN